MIAFYQCTRALLMAASSQVLTTNALAESVTDDRPIIEEFIVKTEKCEEKLLEVPVTMSAFSDERI
jgi:hypothetical protein